MGVKYPGDSSSKRVPCALTVISLYIFVAANEWKVCSSDPEQDSLFTWTHHSGNSLVAQIVKNLPAVQETQVRSLGREDPLETEMSTHSSSLVWKISWAEELGVLQSIGLQRVGHNWVHMHTSYPISSMVFWDDSPNGWKLHESEMILLQSTLVFPFKNGVELSIRRLATC